jgi:hypothetical protein
MEPILKFWTAYSITFPYSNIATAQEDLHYWNPRQQLKQTSLAGFYRNSIIAGGSDDYWIMQWKISLLSNRNPTWGLD